MLTQHRRRCHSPELSDSTVLSKRGESCAFPPLGSFTPLRMASMGDLHHERTKNVVVLGGSYGGMAQMIRGFMRADLFQVCMPPWC